MKHDLFKDFSYVELQALNYGLGTCPIDKYQHTIQFLFEEVCDEIDRRNQK